MLRLLLTRTSHGLLQPDTARALDGAMTASGGRLALASEPCVTNVHVFGWSLDLNVVKTLDAFRVSGVGELAVAGRDRQSLGRWLRQFGVSEAKSPRGHYDVLDGHRTVLARIDQVYGPQMALNNFEVQRALAAITGQSLPDDGCLDARCDYAARLADGIIGTSDRGAFSLTFRRELAVAAAEIIEVGSV